MASSSGSQRFYDCLDVLREEFEILTAEIDSMKLYKDELEAIINSQRQELERIRRSIDQSGPLEAVIPSQQTIHFSTQDPISDSPLTFVASDTIAAVSASVSTFISPAISTVIPDSSHRELDWSITFNDEVEKELDIKMMHTLIHENQIVCSVRFSHDGKHLATGCTNGKAYIYDVETGKLACVLGNLCAEHDAISNVCFSYDGKYLASTSDDMYIYIWEINTRFGRNAFKGHSFHISSLDFSPNGRLLVSVSTDNSVRLWNMRDGAQRILIDDKEMFFVSYVCAVFSPDGRHVAASHFDGMVRIWDARTGQLMRRVKAHMDSVVDIAFMPDGQGLMSGSGDMTLKYWDISSLGTSRFNYWRREIELQKWPEREFLGHEYSVSSVAISRDGRWVASCSDDYNVRIWDSRNAAMQCILNGVHEEMHSVDFCPAACYLASGGWGGTVKVWRYSSVA